MSQNNVSDTFLIVSFKTKIKNAVSYGGASSTVEDPVLFECKALTVDCFNFNKFQ